MKDPAKLTGETGHYPSDTPICPLLSIRSAPDGMSCRGSDCAWWMVDSGDNGDCSVKEILVFLAAAYVDGWGA